MTYKISIDVGGTFTDLVLVDLETGVINNFKALTTPKDLTKGLMESINLAAKAKNLSTSELLDRTKSIIHGTTASTNALIQGNISKVGVITTRGFVDILWAREAGREEPFNWKVEYPPPMVPRYRILPVTGRVNSEGGIEIPLNEEDVRDAIKKFKEWNVEAIAVCLMWSISNSKHEERIEEIIKEEWPGIEYDLSHRVNPIIREYRRFIATVINSSLKKLVKDYLSKINDTLKDNGFDGTLFLITSSGGVLSPTELINKPILTVASGPSMLPVSSLKIAKLERNSNNVIGIDMGGTSFDVGFVRMGEIAITTDAKINPTEMGGDKLGIAKVDVESVGAGGGSIAWIDNANYLHVGPMSSGADPGPACYGLGGENPTVTDANLLLGYLDPEYFLGGQMKIYSDKSEQVIKSKISKNLGIDVIEAASRIYTTINYDMLLALRDLSIKRGVDPRESIMICGGGAYGMHAAEIARELGVKEIIIPKTAGVLCSYGGLISDIKQDFRKTLITISTSFNFEAVNNVIEELKTDAINFLDRAKIEQDKRNLKYFMEAKYPNQVHSLNVPLRSKVLNKENLGDIINDFHDTHFRYYANKDPDSRLEFTGWRVRAIGITPEFNVSELPQANEDPSDALKGKRKAFFREVKGFTEVLTYDGKKLLFGNEINGSAIIEEPITTIVIPPDSSVSITKYGNYLFKIE
ncbi:MAG: hydantoinase/oxoprolinase family protein [Candidatus Lokiarchaeota archaeon]|nr:hydantoinase/oxoprolinase family protein [Candidatus Lokiarchaeota archaeon]MBD3340038.1 hydantoinase/oxoprolinase family protein [Candidatus Lokiarchaeota archaeon]